MYLYIVNFSKRTGLSKIGVSVNVFNRLSTLKKDHGNVLKISVFEGENYKIAEKYLHAAFKNKNVIIDDTDGGTEFFSDIDLKEIENLIKPLNMYKIDFILKSYTKIKESINTKIKKPVKIKSEDPVIIEGLKEHTELIESLLKDESLNLVYHKNRPYLKTKIDINFSHISFVFATKSSCTRVSIFDQCTECKSKGENLLSLCSYLFKNIDYSNISLEVLELFEKYKQLLKNLNCN